MSSMENDGGSRAWELRREYDVLNASFGYQTSRSGVFAEHGGQLGVHYHVFTSLAAATGYGQKDKTGTVTNIFNTMLGRQRLSEKLIIDVIVRRVYLYQT